MALPGLALSPGLMNGELGGINIAIANYVTNSGSNSITIPGGIVAGDIIVVVAFHQGPDAGSITTPSGFTRLIHTDVIEWSGGDTHARTGIYAKRANGTEGGTNLSLWSSGGATNRRLAVLVFSAGAESINAGGATQAGSNTNPAARTVNPSSLTNPCLVIATYRSTAAVDPRTFSPAKDGEISAANNAWVAWKIYNTDPVSTTFDMDDEGNGNLLAGGYIEAL